ncbi:unnamed protein product [Ectocarpus sp. CCAP 1310/34]|nr:unnamed protein product [Ectocarpus sp. CCAP 1310/34]
MGGGEPSGGDITSGWEATSAPVSTPSWTPPPPEAGYGYGLAAHGVDHGGGPYGSAAGGGYGFHQVPDGEGLYQQQEVSNVPHYPSAAGPDAQQPRCYGYGLAAHGVDHGGGPYGSAAGGGYGFHQLSDGGGLYQQQEVSNVPHYPSAAGPDAQQPRAYEAFDTSQQHDQQQHYGAPQATSSSSSPSPAPGDALPPAGDSPLHLFVARGVCPRGKSEIGFEKDVGFSKSDVFTSAESHVSMPGVPRVHAVQERSDDEFGVLNFGVSTHHVPRVPAALESPDQVVGVPECDASVPAPPSVPGKADSGANAMITNKVDAMYNVRHLGPDERFVQIGDSAPIKIAAVGSLDLGFHQIGADGKQEDLDVTVPEVLFVPGCGFNLFSVWKVFHKHKVRINPNAAMDSDLEPPRVTDAVAEYSAKMIDVWESEECERAMAVLGPGKTPFNVGNAQKVMDINTFHNRGGHLSEPILRLSAKQHGITLTGTMDSCRWCLPARGTRAPVPKQWGGYRGKRAPNDLFHIDPCGAYTATIGGNHYMLFGVDAATGWMVCYAMRRKSEALAVVKRMVVDAAHKAGTAIKCIRCDCDALWTSSDFREFCASMGIALEYSPPGVRQYNGVVESAIRRCLKVAKASRRAAQELLGPAGFSRVSGLSVRGDEFWAESRRRAETEPVSISFQPRGCVAAGTLHRQGRPFSLGPVLPVRFHVGAAGNQNGRQGRAVFFPQRRGQPCRRHR